MKTLKPVIVTTTVILLTLISCSSGPSSYEKEKVAREAAYERELLQAFNKHMAFPMDPSADIKITAYDLSEAWSGSNKTRANLLYRYKTLQVTGQMYKAGDFKEVRNGYRITLFSTSHSGVKVYFPITAAEQLLYMETNGVMTPISYGDRAVAFGVVTVVGTCMGFDYTELYDYYPYDNDYSGDFVTIYDAHFVTK